MRDAQPQHATVTAFVVVSVVVFVAAFVTAPVVASGPDLLSHHTSRITSNVPLPPSLGKS
jgi:hypothetical protein